MILRKINAVISLLTTFMIMDHAIFHAVWMLSMGSVEKTADSMPWILCVLMGLHAIISIALAFLGHKGAEKRKCNGYPELNRAAYLQRATGILLIIFTFLHVAGTVGITHPPQIVHAVLPPLFFALTLLHTAISTSKAFITLGIGNAKFIKVADIVMKVLCIVTLIADVTGFYLFVC